MGVKVLGEYLPPETEVDAMRKEFRFRQSEVVSGSLERLPEVLQHAHRVNTHQTHTSPILDPVR